MSVAGQGVSWSHRLNGEDPASPLGHNQGSWDTTVAGTVDGDFWKISASGYNTISTANSGLTMIVSLKYGASIPPAGTILASLDNGVGEIIVKSTGNTTSLTISASGTNDAILPDLDLTQPFFFRLTLDNQHGRFYPFDMEETETGTTLYIERNSTASTSQVSFGCNAGEVLFGNVYYTSDGAFSPSELAPSIWTTDLLVRNGYRIVEVLKNSKRMYLKTFVEDASIIYAHDLSPAVTARLQPPTIFVVVPSLTTNIEALGGGVVYHDYQVEVFVVTRAADYRYAHRLCAEISGEVVEEIYLRTGQDDNKDAVVDFSSSIDMKLEEDEVICVNHHTFKFRRRSNYRKR
jgi:hypothetical protein|tara:strand:+ start:14857 stop:15900 length:1044 start_codon:yes stop_codon:yes gene_type:complete